MWEFSFITCVLFSGLYQAIAFIHEIIFNCPHFRSVGRGGPWEHVNMLPGGGLCSDGKSNTVLLNEIETTSERLIWLSCTGSIVNGVGRLGESKG